MTRSARPIEATTRKESMPISIFDPDITFDPHLATWRTASYSGGVNSECVEVAPASGWVGVRDSKNPTAGQLTVGQSAWRAFIEARKAEGLAY